MKKYARIEDDAVREIIDRPNAFDISKAYHPDLVWVDITGVVPVPQEGWLQTGATFVAPPAPLPPPSKSERIAAELASSPALDGLIGAIAKQQGKTKVDLIAEIEAEAL